MEDEFKYLFTPEAKSKIDYWCDYEREIARDVAKRLKFAIKNHVQDLEFLDNLIDPIWSCIEGMSGTGVRTLFRYFRYLDTFAPDEAKRLRDSYEDSMGFKVHAAYVAARLAKQWHKGQTDKAGKDYFTEHLCKVAEGGFDWKEKAVGFLHDVAEDTPHSVTDIIKAMKHELIPFKKKGYHPEWLYEFEDIVFQYPNEVYHPLTREEWGEIEEALNLLNEQTASSREEYIERLRGHWIAIKVKIKDLDNNMDLTRIPHPTPKDYERMERYKAEREKVWQMFCDLCPPIPERYLNNNKK